MTIKFDHKPKEIYIIKKCLTALKKNANMIPKTENVLYEYWVPSIVYRLLKNEIHKREIQIRIESISDTTGLEPSVVRKLNKDYTLTEIQQGCKDGKVMIEDKVHYERNTDWVSE